jgi:hypothetical protein
MNLLKKYTIVLILVTMFNCSGCGGKGVPSFYINPDVDFSFIKKVAVLPLDNLTNDRFASEAVRHVVISELLASGLVDVVVPGDAISAFENLRLKPGQSLNADQIKALGKALKIQAVILGAVEKYGEAKMGNISAPEVAITLIMADAGSGSIIWSASRTRGGADFWARHFGARAETMSETTLNVVREALHTLYKY